MRCFAISDLHLSLSGEKPMDRFGEHWHRHWERVAEHWKASITADDLVLLPGDHSWAMRLDEADQDLEFIASLPGTKVLTRGNHDYWWQSIGKVRQRYPELLFLQNDATAIGEIGVCGTRGWNLPGESGFADPHDEKIYRRELDRLKLSIAAIPRQASHRIAMIHYPPLLHYQNTTDFTRILEEAAIDICVYGHLHLKHNHRPVRGKHRGVDYQLVSCDYLNFQPMQLTLEQAPEGSKRATTAAKN